MSADLWALMVHASLRALVPIVSVGGTGWVERGKAATIYQSCSPAGTGDIKGQDVLASSRVPIRARSADAEAHCLEVSISPLFCSGRVEALRGSPFEVTAVEPHPVEDHGDLSLWVPKILSEAMIA